MIDKASSPNFIDLRKFRVADNFRGRSGATTQLWWIVQDWLIRPSPQFLYGWRRWLWRLFGAKIGQGVMIRPTARVQFPWKVTIGDRSWIGDFAELYSLGPIDIGADSVVSQYSYICAGTHDYNKLDFPLVAEPVTIGDQVWIATGCYVAPGVTIGRGSVVGAKSVVLKDIPPMTIWAGHPARLIKDRPPAD